MGQEHPGSFLTLFGLAKTAKYSTHSNSFLCLEGGGKKALVTLHRRAKLEQTVVRQCQKNSEYV